MSTSYYVMHMKTAHGEPLSIYLDRTPPGHFVFFSLRGQSLVSDVHGTWQRSDLRPEGAIKAEIPEWFGDEWLSERAAKVG